MKCCYCGADTYFSGGNISRELPREGWFIYQLAYKVEVVNKNGLIKEDAHLCYTCLIKDLKDTIKMVKLFSKNQIKKEGKK